MNIFLCLIISLQPSWLDIYPIPFRYVGTSMDINWIVWIPGCVEYSKKKAYLLSKYSVAISLNWFLSRAESADIYGELVGVIDPAPGKHPLIINHPFTSKHRVMPLQAFYPQHSEMPQRADGKSPPVWFLTPSKDIPIVVGRNSSRNHSKHINSVSHIRSYSL